LYGANQNPISAARFQHITFTVLSTGITSYLMVAVQLNPEAVK